MKTAELRAAGALAPRALGFVFALAYALAFTHAPPAAQSAPAAARAADEAAVLTVFPFRTAAEPAYAFLGESFSEALTTKLVGLRGIKVYERSQFSKVAGELSLEKDAAAFFDAATTSRSGRVVSVDYAILGSATLAGKRLRCEVRLVHVNTGKAVLAQEFAGEYPGELFQLQDKAALAVARALELKLSDLEMRRMTRKPTDDADAYALYNSCLASGDPKGRIALLERALAKDPAFVQALSLLADLYEESGDPVAAMGAYERLLAADPADARAAYNLALLKLDAYDLSGATKLLEKLVAERGFDADLGYHLGLAKEFGSDGARFGAGSDLRAAREQYLRAAAADERHAECRYALGVASAYLAQGAAEPADQLGLVAEAATALRGYLALAPEADNRAEIEENIALLERSKSELEAYLGAKR